MVLPLVGLNRWAALPTQVVRAFNGRSSLPIHELDKAPSKSRMAGFVPFPNHRAM